MLLSLMLSEPPSLLLLVDALSCSILCIFLWLWTRRRRTKRLLEQANLPTVHWRPRFVNYNPKDVLCDKKMKSSSITGILPRMERLKGPFDMYGTVYGISIPVVHVAHPVPARAILMGTSPSASTKRRGSISTSSGATKNPAYNHFKNFSGNGVFTADGDEWKAKRASVLHCLLRGQSQERLEDEANHAADCVVNHLQQQQQKPQNIVPIIQRATVGLIYRYITHDNLLDKPEKCNSSTSSLSSLDTPTDDVSSDEKEDLLQSYLACVNDIRMIILAQSRSFWFLLPRWVYRSFSSLYRQEEQTMGPIRTFAKQACHCAQPGSPLALLRERSSHAVSQDMMDEAITLLFAGQDTSAATLSWTLHLLSLYPDIQDRLVKEIQSVVQQESDDSTRTTPHFSKRLVSKMPFLDAVIKESMRLYPVAPFVVRKLQDNVQVSDDKMSTVIPSGAFCCIWIYGLHRNPQLWKRPNDFVPDRWMDPALRDVGQDTSGAYMPFAVGPRSCVGQPLAGVILRIVLARMIYRYHFSDERLSNHDASKLRKDMQAGFTVLPRGGLKLTVTARPSC